MRKAKDLPLLRNFIYSLALFGQIKTTLTRAKAVQGIVDRLVNKIKKGTVAGKRDVLRFLPQKQIVEKLTGEIVPKLIGRSSGYTRIIKIGKRQGDGAAMGVMEWIMTEEQPKAEAVMDKTATQKRRTPRAKTQIKTYDS